MSFRFQRRVTIIPGVRVNIGKSGASLSLGPSGASVSVGKRGTYANVGFPGTGMSFRSRIDGAQGRRDQLRAIEQELKEEAVAEANIRLQEDGNVALETTDGNELSKSLKSLFWKVRGDQICQWLENQSDKINAEVNDILNIHLDTPKPVFSASYSRRPFAEVAPIKPEAPQVVKKPQRPERKRRAFQRLFTPKKAALADRSEQEAYELELALWRESFEQSQAEFKIRLDEWNAAVTGWRERKAQHQSKEEELEKSFRTRMMTDVQLMGAVLEDVLSSIEWPRETLIDFDLGADGRLVALDVDLPEIEDIPARMSSVSSTGRRLLIKSKSKSALGSAYALHVHGILLRLCGVVFATLPVCKTVVISGYTQRLNASQGREIDTYILSSSVERAKFALINFDNLQQVDPVAAFEPFDTRRKMSRSQMKEIKPIEPIFASGVFGA